MPIDPKDISSVFDNLFNLFSKFCAGLLNLVRNSQIRDNCGVIGPQYAWAPLQGDDLVLQRNIQEEWTALYELVSFFSRDMPESVKDSINDGCNTIESFIKQDAPLFCANKDQLEGDAAKAIATIISDLKKCVNQAASITILIPDTNALLTQPELREYYINHRKVELVLVPAVISELDKMKIHNNEAVRNKAEKIDRSIKELRRRGDILEGVPVVKNKITLRAIATEPQMAKSLGWLDPENMDDRILASMLEVIRHDLGSPTALVTRDLNLQTKATIARIPYVEPPKVPS